MGNYRRLSIRIVTIRLKCPIKIEITLKISRNMVQYNWLKHKGILLWLEQQQKEKIVFCIHPCKPDLCNGVLEGGRALAPEETEEKLQTVRQHERNPDD